MKRFSDESKPTAPDMTSYETGRALCRLRKHRWIFEGAYFSAQPVCRPNETQPAIICLSFSHRMDLIDEEQRAVFFRYRESVLMEIRSMFSGLCEVEFLGKILGTPMHDARRLEDWN